MVTRSAAGQTARQHEPTIVLLVNIVGCHFADGKEQHVLHSDHSFKPQILVLSEINLTIP